MQFYGVRVIGMEISLEIAIEWGDVLRDVNF